MLAGDSVWNSKNSVAERKAQHKQLLERLIWLSLLQAQMRDILQVLETLQSQSLCRIWALLLEVCRHSLENIHGFSDVMAKQQYQNDPPDHPLNLNKPQANACVIFEAFLLVSHSIDSRSASPKL